MRGLLSCSLPVFLRRVCQVERVETAPEDLARLLALRRERVMLTPNHPTTVEPALMFHLACRAGMWFNTVAARELFDEGWGLVGWLVQQCGAYSIVRGTVDRESFRTTRQILSTAGAKLVVFPEGEVYTANDALLPFRSGVIQLAFWANEDAENGNDPGPVYLMPLGVKYRYTRDMRPVIQSSLRRCEERVGLPVSASDSDYIRLRRIADATMRAMESVYGLPTPDGEDFSPRFGALREAILQRTAEALGARLPADTTLPDRLRLLWNALYEVTRESPPDASPYARRLQQERAERARPLLHDLNRVHNAMAFTDGYVREDPSVERMMDTLRRVEFELFGKPVIGGPRTACVRIGDPVSLGDYADAYRTDKKGTVAAVTRRLEGAVANLVRGEGPSVSSMEPCITQR